MAKKIFKTGSGKTSYPSDVSDEEWAFCAPYLTLMKEDAPQRTHEMYPNCMPTVSERMCAQKQVAAAAGRNCCVCDIFSE